MAMTGRHKIIDGKQFFKYKKFSTKSAADKKAKELKASGRYFVRVQPDGDQYAVFCREKK